jgi:hypothetical protein
VIDDAAMGADQLDLDAEIPIHLTNIPRTHLHGSTMVALAVGARRFADRDARFVGVAPHASPRLYGIPKPGNEVISLPVAIIRAVSDGADVVVCATYIEGSTSPMLDDALLFAQRLGRRGRGAAIVFPVGRETSSAAGSVHASLSLSFRDPASDPRAFCIGPSGREGGWFFWQDRNGALRPFANRGPACRWLAPGDDLALPFLFEDRLTHAESSGASAIAAGAMLLVLAANPRLRIAELDDLLTKTTVPVSPAAVPEGRLADARDAQPGTRDRDGHNAKHGYGRIHAGRACVSASDPVALSLVAIGDDAAATAYVDLRSSHKDLRRAYSKRFAWWAVRALLANRTALHAASALCRHARLTAGDLGRVEAHGAGAFTRQLTILLGILGDRRAGPRPSARVASEIQRLMEQLEKVSHASDERGRFETRLCEVAAELWRKSGK